MRALFALLFALSMFACRPQPTKPAPDEIPPLPPASGTAVGYLVDASRELELREDQLAKLKEIDESLAARNGQIDVQLRQIEKPVPAEQLSPQQLKAGEQPERYNNAPGASTIQTENSVKLRKLRDENDREALEEAFALLDPPQLEKAKRILTDRGIDIPAERQRRDTSDAGGTPLPAATP